MVGVPFLRLALLPQTEILKYVNTEDLFFLSLTSTRCKNIAKTAKRSIEDVKIRFEKEEQMVVSVQGKALIGLRNAKKLQHDEEMVQSVKRKSLLKTLFEVIKPKETKQKSEKTLRDADNMDNRSLNIEQERCPIVFYKEGCYQEFENRVIQHLFTVFKKVEKVSILLLNVANVSSNAFWTYSKNLHKLNVIIDNRKLTYEELIFLFKEVSVPHFSMYTKQGLKYPVGFKHGEMELILPNVTNMDAEIASGSLEICGYGPLPPASELNRFLKAWIAGGSMENLERLDIEAIGARSPKFVAKVLEGITVNMNGDFRAEISRVDGKRGEVGFWSNRFIFKPQN